MALGSLLCTDCQEKELPPPRPWTQTSLAEYFLSSYTSIQPIFIESLEIPLQDVRKLFARLLPGSLSYLSCSCLGFYLGDQRIPCQVQIHPVLPACPEDGSHGPQKAFPDPYGSSLPPSGLFTELLADSRGLVHGFIPSTWNSIVGVCGTLSIKCLSDQPLVPGVVRIQ